MMTFFYQIEAARELYSKPIATKKGVLSYMNEADNSLSLEAIPEDELEAITTKALELQSANEYKSKRKAEYPSIGDQLDQLMKDMKDGTTTHQTACEAVKAKFPKPE